MKAIDRRVDSRCGFSTTSATSPVGRTSRPHRPNQARYTTAMTYPATSRAPSGRDRRPSHRDRGQHERRSHGYGQHRPGHLLEAQGNDQCCQAEGQCDRDHPLSQDGRQNDACRAFDRPDHSDRQVLGMEAEEDNSDEEGGQARRPCEPDRALDEMLREEHHECHAGESEARPPRPRLAGLSRRVACTAMAMGLADNRPRG